MIMRNLLAAGLMLVPALAAAVSKDLGARGWLQQVPALPTDAQTAYAQWLDDGNGGLKPGPGFTAVTRGLADMQKDMSQAQMALPQMQQQVAYAQQMQAQYGTPEGQAKLQSMTPAQLMAMAQQMQQPAAGPGIVSPHDQALLPKLSPDPDAPQVLAGVTKVLQAIDTLKSQWQQERSSLDLQEQQERSKLPVCPGEASIPSGQSLLALAQKYGKMRAALAAKYLPRAAPLVQQLRMVVTPQIDYGDDASAAWKQLESASLKRQTSGSMQGAEGEALGDVGTINSTIRDLSQMAAQPVADGKRVEKIYAGAKGC